MKFAAKWTAISVVVLCFLTAQASVILWDINEVSGTANDGSVSNFIALGVTEDLAGATVSQVTASTNSTMTDGTISLTYLSGAAQSATSYVNLNSVLADYLYLQDGSNGGPVSMQISGLSGVLLANTTYSFYLIGAGDNTNQGAQFTFGGDTKTTTSAATAPEAAVAFSFVTGATVSDTLDFTWERDGSNTYSGLNGFAIAAVPEPASMGLFGLAGFGIYLARRNALRNKNSDA